jgi:transmembrane sensor
MSYLERVAEGMRKSTPVPERESSVSSLKLNILLLAESAVQRNRNKRRVVGGCTAILLGATGLIAAHGIRAVYSERPIEYQLAGSSNIAPVGQYVAPTTQEPLALKFSEGSVVELKPGARARVARTTVHGATVLLETGGAKVDVVHRPVTDWTILAGPYTVHVTGTAFQLDYESSSQRFELSMKSGAVNVEGPGLAHPVQVKGQEHFVHYVGEPRFEHRNAVSVQSAKHEPEAAVQPSSSALNVADAVQAELDRLNKHAFSSREKANRASGAESQVGWAAEVARGEYASVFRKANEKGWGQVLTQANQADLVAVANAARFMGRVTASREALEAIRRRFKGTYAAHSATYLMGRLTEPSSPREAIGWYLQYEREAPGGPLLAEAAGRRLLMVQAVGDRSGAERLAHEYVTRFPDGPYAGVARKIALP